MAINLAEGLAITHNVRMTDDKEPPKQPNVKPANVNQPAQVRSVRPKSSKQPSAESRFIGYLVLGFGCVAVLAVVMLGLSMRKGERTTGEQTPKAVASAPILSQKALQEPTLPPALAQKAAKDLYKDLADPSLLKPQNKVKPDLFFKRNPALTSAQIEGAWQGVIGRYVAALKMKDGTYQLILADPDSYSSRPYSSGTYTKNEDLLILEPQRSWPTPKPPAGTDVFYSNITISSFPVLAGIEKGYMLWQAPPESETRVRYIGKLPIMMSEDQDYIVWKKLAE